MLFLKYQCMKNHIGLNINNWKFFPLKAFQIKFIVGLKTAREILGQRLFIYF